MPNSRLLSDAGTSFDKADTWWTTTRFLGFAALAVPVVADSAGVMDDETRTILEETASGRPPSVWN